MTNKVATGTTRRMHDARNDSAGKLIGIIANEAGFQTSLNETHPFIVKIPFTVNFHGTCGVVCA
jgi:hypothetical protein